jgi:hypothetical protein
MLRMMIGQIPTVERHSYRRAKLRGRAWLARPGRLAVLVPATLSTPGIAGVEAAARAAYLFQASPVRCMRMIERNIFKVTHVLPCRNAGVSRY